MKYKKNNKLKKNDKKKINLLLIIIMVVVLLLVKGPPTTIDDKFIKFLYKKDIIPVLIGTLISNFFTSNISSVTESVIIPYLSLITKTNLDIPIKINGIAFNTKKIISSLINLLISVLTIIIVFNNSDSKSLL